MARRADHSREELKNLVLEAAWKIVGAEGFAGLTARSVAADIGYAPGTIYNVFASMDDLYLAVNSRTLDRLYEVLSNLACNDPQKTPVQNMKKMASLYMAFARENRPYWLMLFSHRQAEGQAAPPWYQEKIDRLFSPLEQLLEPLFNVSPSAENKMAARVLWSSVHGLCLLQETGKIALVGERAPEAMADYLIDAFTSGINSRQ